MSREFRSHSAILAWRAVIGALALVAHVGVNFAAQAHDFYSTIKNPLNQSCCGLYDCAPLPSERLRVGDGEFAVEYQGAWLPVPEDHVVRDGAPDGQVHACIVRAYNAFGLSLAPYVRCLILPPLI